MNWSKAGRVCFFLCGIVVDVMSKREEKAHLEAVFTIPSSNC